MPLSPLSSIDWYRPDDKGAIALYGFRALDIFEDTIAYVMWFPLLVGVGTFLGGRRGVRKLLSYAVLAAGILATGSAMIVKVRADRMSQPEGLAERMLAFEGSRGYMPARFELMNQTLGQKAEVRAALERAIAREPDDVRASSGLGFLFHLSRRYDFPQWLFEEGSPALRQRVVRLAAAPRSWTWQSSGDPWDAAYLAALDADPSVRVLAPAAIAVRFSGCDRDYLLGRLAEDEDPAVRAAAERAAKLPDPGGSETGGYVGERKLPQ
jgi:hypothetical protein